jgi:DNA modification methylase
MRSLDDLTAENPLLLQGDCIELMKTLPDKSVDLAVCDLPYGELDVAWDRPIDLAEFWRQFKRVRRSKKTACIHFCSTKFGYTLIKSWEKGYKMDMVWKKRNKTGGLQSRYRPMRNHEMVYFFYEQAPKYNRDKYHKRIGNQNVGGEKNGHGFDSSGQANFGANSHEPPNPPSVLEEGETEQDAQRRIGTKGGASEKEHIYTAEQIKRYREEHGKFDVPTPASVLEETDGVYAKAFGGAGFGYDGERHGFDPQLPCSMFESGKTPIGKRHHQTEKPQDILEFFLKYYSDEGDVVLDPTMGSGSTGVACKRMGRKFIGMELTDKYYAVAQKRISEQAVEQEAAQVV